MTAAEVGNPCRGDVASYFGELFNLPQVDVVVGKGYKVASKRPHILKRGDFFTLVNKVNHASPSLLLRINSIPTFVAEVLYLII